MTTAAMKQTSIKGFSKHGLVDQLDKILEVGESESELNVSMEKKKLKKKDKSKTTINKARKPREDRLHSNKKENKEVQPKEKAE